MKLLIITLTYLFCNLVSAATIKFNPADGKTEFLAVGKPAMIKIKGHGNGPEGNLNIDKDLVSGSLTVNLEKLTTEIDLRDEHMKNKYLEVGKYPKAELTFKDFKLPVAFEKLQSSETEVPFTANFTLHGKTQPVSGVAKLTKSGQQLKGEAKFDIKIMQYLESLPSYAGIKVAEDVNVTVQLNGQIESSKAVK